MNKTNYKVLIMIEMTNIMNNKLLKFPANHKSNLLSQILSLHQRNPSMSNT